MTGKDASLYFILGVFVRLIAQFYFTALQRFLPHANGTVADAIVATYVLATVSGPILVLLSIIWYGTLAVQVDGRAALRTLITSVGYTACNVVFILFSLGTADI